MSTTASGSPNGTDTSTPFERPRAEALVRAAAMASRVLELESLVNSQAAMIESLEAQVSSLGAVLGRRWDVAMGDDFGESVRHRRCRGR